MIRLIFQEIAALFYALLFYLFDQVKYDGKGAKRALVLVHGYLHNSSGWWAQRARLGRECYTVNLGHPFKSMQDYLRKLEERMVEIGAEEIVFVGHSMGGLIAAAYAMKYPDRVRGVITLGSPLEGSIIAKIGLTPALREMSPGSDYLKKLHEKMAKSRTRFIHIGSTGDEMVIPNASTVARIAPNTECVTIPLLGHISYLISWRTTKELLHALDCLD